MKTLALALLLGILCGFLDNRLKNLQDAFEAQQDLLNKTQDVLIYHHEILKTHEKALLELYKKYNNKLTCPP